MWMKYRQIYGNLNPMMRTEWGAALIACTLSNINLAKDATPFKVSDFAPHLHEAAVSLAVAMKQWA